MFKSILVANRGEIAVRVTRACREMGIASVAAYSEADRDALHVQLADRAMCVGPAPSRESYLNIPNIISAALITGCDAIHPGYGFLSENATFADACKQCNLTFIGPPSSAIEMAGDKARAIDTMRRTGIPIIPGSKGILQTEKEALKSGKRIGYPVIIKAAAGGGGKGMRVVRDAGDMAQSFKMAQHEAQAAFGNPEVYLEKYLEEPRHVEVQIVADKSGHIVHLGERDCSIQTARHQKMLEESPSPALTPKLRAKIGEAAVRAARAVGYRNAGTVEFLLDRKHRFYFMEMNTRIQVEHPVTEEVSGLDLVALQIAIAAGEPLPFAQKDIVLNGHCIECRITAEDPERNFAPSVGVIRELHLPSGFGVRVDTHLYQGYRVPTYYDSLLAKVICWGKDRDEAIARMKRALSEMRVGGVRTTIEYHRRILENPAFVSGEVSTAFIASEMAPPMILAGARSA